MNQNMEKMNVDKQRLIYENQGLKLQMKEIERKAECTAKAVSAKD